MTRWHILSPEYPPACGGVGDYTRLVGQQLSAAGDGVRIWHPASGRIPGRAGGTATEPMNAIGITVLPDRFGSASRALVDRALARDPGVVLVQYVPSAFGVRGSNLMFCRWLLGLGRRGVDVRVMFHEPYFYFGLARPWRNVVALTQRLMAAILIRASRVVYLSTERWLEYLSPYGSLAAVSVLPMPATIPVDVRPESTAAARRTFRGGCGFVIGHFGTYGDHVGDPLRRIIPLLLARVPTARLLLIGDGSEAFLERLPLSSLDATRMQATGRLSPAETAAALRACDVLVQPYPDGATTRRTSLMAGLTSGRPVVSTDGALTERVWHDTGAVALAPPGDDAALVEIVVRLSCDRVAADTLGARGRRVYDDQFAIEHTVATLRGCVARPASAAEALVP